MKVLDFGLAKVLDTAEHGSQHGHGVPHGHRIVDGHTGLHEPRAGARRRVGRQTDIWAFGGVLYELLTGVSAFGRPSTAETLVQVMNAQPDFARLPAADAAGGRPAAAPVPREGSETPAAAHRRRAHRARGRGVER